MRVSERARLAAANLMCASGADVLLKCCWLVSAGECVHPEEIGQAGGGLLHVPQGWAPRGRWGCA